MAASIGEMVAQSRDILTHRSVATIEKYEKAGGLQEALIYMGIAAAITGFFSIFGGIGAFIAGVLSTLISFLCLPISSTGLANSRVAAEPSMR